MEIGNLSEIIGSVAVVASVIYLAQQVKKQTDESRLAASRELASDFIQILRSVGENPELAHVLAKGIHDYDELAKDERLRLSYFFAAIFRVAEQQHLHTTRGTLDPVYFTSFNLAFIELMTCAGPRRWWELSNNMFSDEFRQYVETVIADANKRGAS